MSFEKLKQPKKILQEEGYALVVTVILLIVMTIFLIFTFQNSTLNLFISQNILDQPTAQNSATACEQHTVRRLIGPERLLAPFSIDNPGGIQVSCSSNTPFPVDLNRPIVGTSATILTNTYRFRTVGSGRRNAQFASFTDITIVRDLRQETGY